MNNQGVVGIAISSESLLFAIWILAGFLGLAILVSMMRIYKKAGKPQISVIIPIWSQIVLFQIVKIPVWWIFIPIANIIFMIKAYLLLAKKFGKGVGFGLGMIFLPMIFIPLLSFYDYIGDEEEKKEETIYNPFNETNVEQVMPSAPIDSAKIVTPEMPVNVEVSPIVEASVQESTPVLENTNEVIEEVVENSNIEMINNEAITEESINDSVIPIVEPIMPVVDSVIEVNNNEVVEEPIEQIPNAGLQNPTVEDIENILNVKSSNEPVNIAFGATPQVVGTTQEKNVSVMETLEMNNQVESLNINSDSINAVETFDNPVSINEEVLEMPEMAAKTCPACGVSLAEDVKFCTSCGTQL